VSFSDVADREESGRPAPPQLVEGSDEFKGLDATAVDFWRWAFSDLRDNIVRGVLAEFLVAAAVGRTETRHQQPHELPLGCARGDDDAHGELNTDEGTV